MTGKQVRLRDDVQDILSKYSADPNTAIVKMEGMIEAFKMMTGKREG